MTAALEGVSGQQHVPAALYPRKRPGTHFTGGWVKQFYTLLKKKVLAMGFLFEHPVQCGHNKVRLLSTVTERYRLLSITVSSKHMTGIYYI